MARFFPARSQCQFDTPGERRFAERLEKLLEDDYLCWSNVPVGPKARYPDFVVLHPRRGILVLEVKDWKLATLESVTHGKVRLHTQDGLKTVANPLLQARSYILEVDLLLKKDPLLRQSAGSPHPGQLIMPWGWGVVLTGITLPPVRADRSRRRPRSLASALPGRDDRIHRPESLLLRHRLIIGKRF